MRYINSSNHQHGNTSKIGILIVNLGTPTAPNVRAVRAYLREFLTDPRLVELPRPLWWLILHGLILPFRPARSARAYQRVWTPAGSPLLVISKLQLQALRTILTENYSDQVQIELGMRYGVPSITDAIANLQHAGVQKLLVLPLYPQYSATTTGSVFDAVTSILQRWRVIPELRFIRSYHTNPLYINALVKSVHQYWDIHGRPDQLLMSFHGIPKSYTQAGDPYYWQCKQTAELLATALKLDHKCWQMTFQSRLGSAEWLTPYTDQQLQSLAQHGTRKVQIICPGFATDCLETLDEIAVENREYFLHAGGTEYGYIPALNATSEHITTLAIIIKQHLCGWTNIFDAIDNEI